MLKSRIATVAHLAPFLLSLLSACSMPDREDMIVQAIRNTPIEPPRPLVYESVVHYAPAPEAAEDPETTPRTPEATPDESSVLEVHGETQSSRRDSADLLEDRSIMRVSPVANRGAFAVATSSILAFPDELTQQQRSDVQSTMYFASLAADQEYDMFRQRRLWLGAYIKWLRQVGWAPTGQPSHDYEWSHSERDLRMEEVALEILQHVSHGIDLSSLEDALGRLQASDGEDLSMFEYYSSSGSEGSFQLGVAGKEPGSDTVILALGAYHFTADSKRRRFLFWTWRAGEIEFWAEAHSLTLSESFGNRAREALRERLEAVHVDAIETAPLP